MEQVNNIKHELFALRNGVVADALRKAGAPHRFIMGCTLSDIATLAQACTPGAPLAQALWDDASHRECRLLAPMLYPPEQFSRATAMQWCRSLLTHEEADVLCHRLLRHLPYRDALVDDLLGSDGPMTRYCAFRLMLNILLTAPATSCHACRWKMSAVGAVATATPQLRAVLMSIIEEFE